MLNLLLPAVLIAAATACGKKATTPEPTTQKPSCSPNSTIDGVFVMVDGTGTFEGSWPLVGPFVRYFKSYVDRELPVWFLQWSSKPEFCQYQQSWGCKKELDHCANQTEDPSRCPTTQIQKIPANWTDQQFDDAVHAVYDIYQDGWTRPWGYIEMVANLWIEAKNEMGLGPDARALAVFLSDGEAQDGEHANDAIKKFKESKLKFLGVYQNTKGYTFDHYYPLMDDSSKPDVITTPSNGSVLNDELAKHIFKTGCA